MRIGFTQLPDFVQTEARWVSGLVATCFLISGAAGLVYKVIWMRLIDKLVGGTPSAVATVLAVYMGGLAQGSYLAGRLIDRTARRSICLAAYGVLRSVSV